MISKKKGSETKPQNSRELKANPNLKIKKEDLDRLLKAMLTATDKIKKGGK